MAPAQMKSKADSFFAKAKTWQAEMAGLRRTALACGLSEDLKWGKPCYTFEGSNVAIIQPFKERCAFMFFKGALLDDPRGLLEKPGENSHAARRMMFASVAEVTKMQSQLRRFIARAIELEKAGLKVETKSPAMAMPAELEEAFKQTKGLKNAFEALTPGRQRAYLLHVSGAKQPATRRSRIEKCVPNILAGKGLND